MAHRNFIYFLFAFLAAAVFANKLFQNAECGSGHAIGFSPLSDIAECQTFVDFLDDNVRNVNVVDENGDEKVRSFTTPFVSPFAHAFNADDIVSPISPEGCFIFGTLPDGDSYKAASPLYWNLHSEFGVSTIIGSTADTFVMCKPDTSTTATSEPTREQIEFICGDSVAPTCPTGYSHVTSQINCNAFVTSGSSCYSNNAYFQSECNDNGNSQSWCEERPQYCFQSDNGAVIFNKNTANVGVDFATPVCFRNSVMCTCTTPNAGQDGHNQFTCTNGETRYCASNEACYNIESFPHSQWDKGCKVSGHYVVMGRPGASCFEEEDCSTRVELGNESFAIRCCDGEGRFWYKRPECSTGVTGASEFEIDNSCRIGDYSTAFDACNDNGARLCTKEEVESGCVAYSGCDFDFRAVWTSTEGVFVADAQSDPPTTALPTTMRPIVFGAPKKRWIVQRKQGGSCDDEDNDCQSRTVLTESNYAISCCADDDINQEWPQRNQQIEECQGVWTESDIWYMHHDISKERRCTIGTWYDAERICKENGGRLCTKMELESGCAESTGCEFDFLMNWSSDQ